MKKVKIAKSVWADRLYWQGEEMELTKEQHELLLKEFGDDIFDQVEKKEDEQKEVKPTKPKGK